MWNNYSSTFKMLVMLFVYNGVLFFTWVRRARLCIAEQMVTILNNFCKTVCILPELCYSATFMYSKIKYMTQRLEHSV